LVFSTQNNGSTDLVALLTLLYNNNIPYYLIFIYNYLFNSK
jgi:hypothetical protein